MQGMLPRRHGLPGGITEKRQAAGAEKSSRGRVSLCHRPGAVTDEQSVSEEVWINKGDGLRARRKPQTEAGKSAEEQAEQEEGALEHEG